MARKKVLDLPPEVRAYYSAASARRQRVDSACQVCGAPMRDVLPTRRCCSRRCVDRAAYQRKRQATAAQPSAPIVAPTEQNSQTRQARLSELERIPILTDHQLAELLRL